MSVSAVATWASIESLALPPVAPIRRCPPVLAALPVAGELPVLALPLLPLLPQAASRPPALNSAAPPAARRSNSARVRPVASSPVGCSIGSADMQLLSVGDERRLRDGVEDHDLARLQAIAQTGESAVQLGQADPAAHQLVEAQLSLEVALDQCGDVAFG